MQIEIFKRILKDKITNYLLKVIRTNITRLLFLKKKNYFLRHTINIILTRVLVQYWIHAVELINEQEQ